MRLQLLSQTIVPRGPLKIFINDTNSGIKWSLSKFANNTKLRRAGDEPEGWANIQRDLHTLKKLVQVKCRVLHLGHGNSWNQHSLGAEQPCWEGFVGAGGETAGHDPGTGTGAKHVLGCMQSSVGSRSRRGFSPLLHPAETPHRVLQHLWAPQHRNDTGPLEQVCRKPPRWPEGWAPLPRR